MQVSPPVAREHAHRLALEMVLHAVEGTTSRVGRRAGEPLSPLPRPTAAQQRRSCMARLSTPTASSPRQNISNAFVHDTNKKQPLQLRPSQAGRATELQTTYLLSNDAGKKEETGVSVMQTTTCKRQAT